MAGALWGGAVRPVAALRCEQFLVFTQEAGSWPGSGLWDEDLGPGPGDHASALLPCTASDGQRSSSWLLVAGLWPRLSCSVCFNLLWQRRVSKPDWCFLVPPSPKMMLIA